MKPDPITRLGGWLFRQRSWLPLPIAAALLVIPGRSSSIFSTRLLWAGVLVVLTGELLRLWAVHHIGVIFAGGNIAATFTIDEEDTVAEDGKSYTGTFEFNQFDPSGNPAGSFKGTTAAKRVTFKTPSTEVD